MEVAALRGVLVSRQENASATTLQAKAGGLAGLVGDAGCWFHSYAGRDRVGTC